MKDDWKIYNELPILEVAARLGIKVPVNGNILCFLHEEKTPSLHLDDNKNIWKCFGCGAGGGVIELVKLYKRVDFKDAIKWLESELSIRKGYHCSGRPGIKRHQKETKKIRSQSNLEVDEKTKEIFQWIIEHSALSATGENYLLINRGFSKAIIEEQMIRDLPNPISFLAEAKKVFGVDNIVKAGLMKVGKLGELKYTWWDHVIVFPFINEADQITYLQGRRLKPDNPKYVNLSKLPCDLYNRKILANLKNGDMIYICEGITDCITALELELKAVAVLGVNNFKEEWFNLLSHYRIRIIPDADNAGKTLENYIRRDFLKMGKSIETIQLPSQLDFSEYIRLKQEKHNENKNTLR